MTSKRQLLLLFLTLLLSVSVYGQSDVHLKASAVAFNLLSDEGDSPVIFEPGIVFSYNLFLRDRTMSLRLTQTIRMNEYQKIEGFSTAKFHVSIYQKWKTDINFGIGTGIAYRMSEVATSDMVDSHYKQNGKMETGNLFVTGGIEYNYAMFRNLDLSVSIDHVYPVKVFLNAGIRYWISKKIKKRHKCMTCPDWG